MSSPSCIPASCNIAVADNTAQTYAGRTAPCPCAQPCNTANAATASTANDMPGRKRKATAAMRIAVVNGITAARLEIALEPPDSAPSIMANEHQGYHEARSTVELCGPQVGCKKGNHVLRPGEGMQQPRHESDAVVAGMCQGGGGQQT